MRQENDDKEHVDYDKHKQYYTACWKKSITKIFKKCFRILWFLFAKNGYIIVERRRERI